MNKKTIFFFLIFFFVITSVFTQESSESPRYRLFKTENMWTFLKLDTMTGQIWQVHFSLNDEDSRYETVLNEINIPEELEKPLIIGRYTLYPTDNMYNFILLDQIDGITMQVQWSWEKKYRYVVPIYDFYE